MRKRHEEDMQRVRDKLEQHSLRLRAQSQQQHGQFATSTMAGWHSPRPQANGTASGAGTSFGSGMGSPKHTAHPSALHAGAAETNGVHLRVKGKSNKPVTEDKIRQMQAKALEGLGQASSKKNGSGKMAGSQNGKDGKHANGAEHQRKQSAA